eukprot:5126565-Prorocentrum_lima.AAC.1
MRLREKKNGRSLVVSSDSQTKTGRVHLFYPQPQTARVSQPQAAQVSQPQAAQAAQPTAEAQVGEPQAH